MSALLGSAKEIPEIGDTFVSFAGIEFKVVKNGESNKHYIWMHGDEKTANMAINYHLKHYNGTAFLIKSDEREVIYHNTKIDPNRIFSRSGSFRTLTKFKLEWAPGTIKKALNELDQERGQFLDMVFPDSGGILISVHNNFRGYNLRYELKNHTKVSINPKENLRDFIICTDHGDFDILSKGGHFNVILQDQLPEGDDGSLSWAAIRNGIRYVNIEARLGWLSQQKKMLKFVEERLN
ncbi:MAG TPA: hypothetical protein QGH56_09210 [Candidatus Marinimicrobia bacterium]|jgi:hypothetical protein|nr:hypothetical protein [Candidatus Neomarinimicrobiota bacterium]|tara:strand:- start:2146 stop:2856 length:711 start_codon:yes stop_codon:yes gene_type:complete